MFFRKNKKIKSPKTFTNINYSLIKKGATSGGSRRSYKFKLLLPLQVKMNRLRVTNINNAGRNKKGRIIFWTRKSLKFKKLPININYSFRLKSISFISSIIILPFSHKILSLVFTSTGSFSYVPTTFTQKLFSITRLSGFIKNKILRKKKFNLINTLFYINQSFFLIRQLPRNQPISLLEKLPGQGVKYVRSPGVSAFMYKLDFKTDTALVKLPSGVRKVFSTFSLGSKGANPFLNNKYWKSNKSGYYRNFGVKSKVRGSAMNPIDHPHGGRTKSINYPRTPWGKTTKFK